MRQGSGKNNSPAGGLGAGLAAAPHDQRTAWAYVFGAICPGEGKGAGLVMPFCDTEAMQAHLVEISAMVTTPMPTDPRQSRGISPARSSSRTTSPSCRCRRARPSSTRSRTSGSSCATTGSRTASSQATTTSSQSSQATTTSSLTAALPGMTSSTSHGASDPSGAEPGRKGSNQCALVLVIPSGSQAPAACRAPSRSRGRVPW